LSIIFVLKVTCHAEDYLKARLREAPISKFLGHSLISCKNGRATVRLPYREEFQQSYGVVRNGKNLIVCEMIVYGKRRR